MLNQQKNQLLLDLFNQYPQLNDFFADLTLTRETKLEALEKLLVTMDLDVNYKNGLALFIDHNHGAYLSGLLSEIKSLTLQLLNQKMVVVSTPSPLSDSQKAKLETLLKKKNHAELIFDYKIDPTIVLGIKVKIDDELKDFTLNTQLKTLKSKITTETT